MHSFIQLRFAHILNKRNRFPSFFHSLAYVRANWEALKEQVSVKVLWKPKHWGCKIHRKGKVILK